MFFSRSNDIEVDNCYIHGDGNSLAESWPGITPHENAHADADANDFGHGFNWGIYAAHGGGSNITIRNCHIEQCHVGMSLAHATNSIIENNHIHHCTDDGINLAGGCENSEGEQTVIANNHIHDMCNFSNPSIGGHNDGIQLQGVSGPDWVDYINMIIRGNHIHHIQGQGMWLRVGGLSNNWLLENNLVYDVPSGTGASVTLKIISVKHLTFRNNTVDGFLEIKSEIGDTPTIDSFTGNIVEQLNIWTNNGDVILTYENYNVVNRKWLQMTEHIFGENSIVLNSLGTPYYYDAFKALFNDYDNEDYTLASDSSAIDLSVSSKSPATDILGNYRDAQPDAGCYEYGASSGTFQPPEPPGEPTETHADLPDVTSLTVSNNIIKKSENTSATIQCFMKEAGQLTVKIYDAKGREIITLCNEHKEAGIYSFSWSGNDAGTKAVGSGIYIVHMVSGGYKKTKKIAVIK